jgi:hypothetical protein
MTADALFRLPLRLATFLDVSDADPARLLARHSEHGYVSDVALAMDREPEAIPAALQDHYAQDARRRDRARKLARWRSARQTMLDGAKEAEAVLGMSFRSDLRAVGRAVARIDRQLSAG